MTKATLYRWPPAARFGRVVPKTRIHEYGRVSSKVRKRLVAEVERISWEYKLADETVHLRGDATVSEIQVFVVDARAEDVSDEVLTAIDRAVPFPIIFEITRETATGAQTRMVASYKRAAIGHSRPQLGSYCSTDWFPAGASRWPLPAALDLPGLYAGLLKPLLPIPTRPGESLSDANDRMSQVAKLEREIAALNARFDSEPQFNRKVELRRQLRDRGEALAQLSDADLPNTEDHSWTS